MLIVTLILPLIASMGLGGIWARDQQRELAHAERITEQVDLLSVLSQIQFTLETRRLYLNVAPGMIPSESDADTTNNAAPQTARVWRSGRSLVEEPETLDALSDGTGSRLLAAVLDREEASTANPQLATIDDDLSASVSDMRYLIGSVRDNADGEVANITAVFDQFSDLQALMLVEAETFLSVLSSPVPSTDSAMKILKTGAQQDALIQQILPRLPQELRTRMLTGLSGEDMSALRDAILTDASLQQSAVTFAAALTPERLNRVQKRYFTLPEIRVALAGQLSTESSQATTAAENWLRTALIIAGAMIAMTVAIAALLSRMVLQRLTLLAARASRVGDGTIDDQPLPPGGPREIAEVTTAFNRMSDLLLTLDRQVGAISQARLHDPSLQKQLPGRIGSEIQASVQLIADTTESLRAAEALAAAIIDAAVDGIVTVDEHGVVLSANAAAGAICGIEGDQLTGRNLGDALPNLPPFERLLTIENNEAITLQRVGAEPVAALVSARQINNADGSSVRAYFIRDISERAAWEELFRYQATHDELTDLPNRFGLHEHLELIGVRALTDARVSILSIDLDRFKYFNDAHGHAKGDQVLRAVADQLRKAAGSDTFVARTGGDEFAAVLDVTGHPDAGVSAAGELAQRISAALAEPIALDDERPVLQSCIGIASGSGNGAGLDELLRFANIALFQAKELGSGSISVYDEGMSGRMEGRARIEQRLRVALATDELEMFAQPIVELSSEQITGVELLARWRCDGSWIPPDVFIPIAEETGLIPAVGRWAMGCAVNLLTEFHRAGLEQSVSVNISGLHLVGGEVASELAGLLAGTTFDRSKLRVELTESVLLTDPDLAATRLSEIRDLGAQLVIDDFGTGYSSLTYLHRLPIDGLKLDRSFVMRLNDGEQDDTIVRLVNDLAVGLHLDLVAEGVETDEQRRSLIDHGYTRGQGYLWSRAVPIGELWPLLHANEVDATHSAMTPSAGS